MSVYEATEALKKILDFVRKLQTLVRLNRKVKDNYGLKPEHGRALEEFQI